MGQITRLGNYAYYTFLQQIEVGEMLNVGRPAIFFSLRTVTFYRTKKQFLKIKTISLII